MAKAKKVKEDKNVIVDKKLFTSAEEALKESANLNVVPTTPSLDEKLGGGIAEGSLVLIRTRPKVGKTVLTMQIAHNALMQGRHVFFIDAEARLLGSKYFQITGWNSKNTKFQILKTKKGKKTISGEEIYKQMMNIMKLPKYRGSVFIIDSFSAITPQDTIDDPEVRADRRDGTPKLNADFCKKVGNLIRSSDCIVIGTQHFTPDTTPGSMGKLKADGGEKLPFYSDIVLEAKHFPLSLDGDNIYLKKGEEETLGQTLRLDMPYNKIKGPFVAKEAAEKILVYIKFGEGVWWAKEAMDVLDKLGLMSRGGAKYYFIMTGLEAEVKGKDEAFKFVENNRDKIEKILQEYYTTEYGVNYSFSPPEDTDEDDDGDE